MPRKKQTDIKKTLKGLHKIVSAISSMRNINSDAHGASSSRININKREAILAANYWLSVFENK